MRIFEPQFEEIKNLVIQETGAIVAFYEKKEFSGRLEGYSLVLENPPRICVCRSQNTTCFTRATIVLLHEYGHIKDFTVNKNSKRIKFDKEDKYDSSKPMYNLKGLSRQEKIWFLKSEWYADYYARKFALTHGFAELADSFFAEQIYEYRYVFTELILNKKVTRQQSREWQQELRNTNLRVTCSDIDRLHFV